MSNFRFTIGRKIGTGFGVLIFLTLAVFVLTKKTINSSRKITDTIVHINSPSVDALQQLKILILDSKLLINHWAIYQSPPEHPKKLRLQALLNQKFPQAIARVDTLAKYWTEEEIKKKDELLAQIEQLFGQYEIIMTQLNSFTSYEDPEIKFTINLLVDDGGEIDIQTQTIELLLDELIILQRQKTETGSQLMISSFDRLEKIVVWLGFALFIGGILIAFFTVQSIVKPVQKLRRQLLLLGKGIIPKETMRPRSDEIGDMAQALNDLVQGFKRTTEFAKEIGSGNFESEYQPLSDQDTLGHSLLAMRAALYDLTRNLEQKVKERTEEIEKQKKEIEYLYTQVTDSIKYAKRIQTAILPPIDYARKLLPESFILFRPKDIVSGDFYWMDQKDNKILFGAFDCTGHGVPGAFMTIIGYNKLSEALATTEHPTPAVLLNKLNIAVQQTFNKEGSSATEVKDGMDAALCSFDPQTNQLTFSGAYNPLYLVRNGEIEQIKGDKFPVGAFVEEQNFTDHTVQIQKGDTIYIFSDGYPDQFGGPKGKKFMYKNFRKLLLSIQDKSMQEQHDILNRKLEEWMGPLEQVDDVLIIGVRFN
ncbi:MAG: HAMP domain-containing protein [Bacteroidetes bacterium]|nr:MAG: HAMP domain-containing protein [Bacteroidota bacterium]